MNRISNIHYNIYLIILIVAFIPLAVQAGTQVHPSLLFHDIGETPGYQYRIAPPWNEWESTIISDANKALTYNFADTTEREYYRQEYAYELGLAYQITKQAEYADHARDGLLHMGEGDIPTPIDRSTALRGYSLAYDYIQPTLDAANETIIRDELAIQADIVYKNLSEKGRPYYQIDYDDFQGWAYPDMGIVGCVLSDYTNLSLSSTPADWYKVGTEYFFVNDNVLHDTGGRSLISYGFDEVSGKHLNGGYKEYTITELLWWFQVYSHYKGQNIFDVYPITKRIVTSELWESMPNYYHNNYVTSGNIKYYYHEGILNLLDADTRAQALKHIDMIKPATLLPYSTVGAGDPSAGLLYLVYGDYRLTPRQDPSWTSYLNATSIYQTFRGGWAQDADWLSVVTFNVVSASNRDTGHHDQLGIEYYSRGDLLLADAGENKYVLDTIYGNYEIHHNTIALENPRFPFSVADWSNSQARGIYKGLVTGIVTPVTVTTFQQPWMELLQGQATITNVIGSDWGTPELLSSAVQYNRSILYPKEYFVLIDRLEGTQPWIYRTIFRPTSLTITPSTSSTNVGNVQGSLSLGGNAFNWLGLDYKNETLTGVTSNSLKWTTRNPYGNNVNLEVFTSPSSEVRVEKHVGRIAGYDVQAEVYSPVVSFRSPSANNLYRVTVLLTRYDSETAKEPSELVVTGQGSAVKVHNATFDDYIYTGSGSSSFGPFSTDAGTVYTRATTRPVSYTMVDGSYMNFSGGSFLRVSDHINYLSAIEKADRISLYIKSGSPGYTISLFQLQQSVTGITMDGIPSASWTAAGDTLTFTATQGEHLVDIFTAPFPNRPPSLNPIGNKTVTAGSLLAFTINATDSDGNALTYSAAGLPSGAIFDAFLRTFTWTPAISQNGSYQMKFTVSDGSLTDDETIFITVLPINAPPNRPPTLDPIGNKTVTAGSLLAFTISATDPDGNALTYSAAGLPSGAIFDAFLRTFTWTPAISQTGSYQMTFTVSDGSLTDDKTIFITVLSISPTPSPPIPPDSGSDSMVFSVEIVTPPPAGKTVVNKISGEKAVIETETPPEKQLSTTTPRSTITVSESPEVPAIAPKNNILTDFISNSGILPYIQYFMDMVKNIFSIFKF